MDQSLASASFASLTDELRAADESLVGNEEVLRAVLSGCGDCIKILDLEGRLQFMSEGGKRVMEVENFGSLKGCPWPDFWAGEGNADARNAIETARRGQTARFKGAADTAKGNPRYWDVQVGPIAGSDGGITHLLSISRDITAEWQYERSLKDAAERQHLLSEEMNHRISNTIAVIGAIASQTIVGSDIDAARASFTSRLSTLATANRLLLQSDWEGGSISRIVRVALAPHDPGSDRIRADGPDLHLSAKQALSLALALHELATNATKYGALSNEDGKVQVEWGTDDDGTEPAFVFRWNETQGPVLSSEAPKRRGFGSRLIQKVFAQDFDGAVDISYEPSGLVCELRAPLSALPAKSAA